MKNGKLIFGFVILFFIGLTQAASFLLSGVGNVYYNIVRPFSYLVMLTLALIFVGFNFGYSRAKKTAATILIFGSLVYVAALFVSGLTAGLGQNPMTASIDAVVLNLWQYIPFVVTGEILRFQLMKCADKKHKTLMFWAVSLVFSFAMAENIAGAAGSNAAQVIEFVMTTVLPVTVLNFFLTYICQSGALAGTIFFRCVYSLTPVFLPYLPNVTKIFLAILLYGSIIVMFFLYDKYAFTQMQRFEFSHRRYKWGSYIVPALILAVCVVFGSGVLPAAPVAVASNSMKGEFSRGDMLIIRKLDAEQAADTLKVGDIIQFKSGNIYITHRIIEISTDYRGELQYTTKGDDNDSADTSPVGLSQIVGVAVFKVPYLGYPSVLLMEMMR